MIQIQKEFLTLPIDEVIPYENNPRVNDSAVNDVVASIRQCGNVDPIEVDENNVILSGHTRLKALKALDYTEVQVLRITGLTDEQKRKYRILANKTAEKAEWDFEKLELELDGLDFEGFDFGFDEKIQDTSEEYTNKIDIPQYEPSGQKYEPHDLYNSEKTNNLIKEIKDSDIPNAVKEFLILSAYRHVVFYYKRIADFYALSSPKIQRLMEKSALVIIDYENAIKNGYVTLDDEAEQI